MHYRWKNLRLDCRCTDEGFSFFSEVGSCTKTIGFTGVGEVVLPIAMVRRSKLVLKSKVTIICNSWNPFYPYMPIPICHLSVYPYMPNFFKHSYSFSKNSVIHFQIKVKHILQKVFSKILFQTDLGAWTSHIGCYKLAIYN